MEFDVSYKKINGKLKLFKNDLKFDSSEKAIDIPFERLSTLFSSKANTTPVRLKLDLINPQQSLTFTFTHTANANHQRDKVKDLLSNVIALNRSNDELPGLGLSKYDLDIRKKVLVKNPQLASLHKELVIGNVISEDEFWQGRQQLLKLEHLSNNQKPGKNSTLVDPRPTSSTPGEFTITITPQLVHDIFDEYPIVQKAYVDNVPNPLSETDFWIRYFHSHLFARHRASSRQDANEAKNDEIFDKYLDDIDDDIIPKKPLNRSVYNNLIDLNSTQVDKVENSGNVNDITMQPGKVKSALPLMRRFNEHSSRLLSNTLGDEDQNEDQRRNKKQKYNDYLPQIELEDLSQKEEPAPIKLNMKNSEKYFNSNISITNQNNFNNDNNNDNEDKTSFKNLTITDIENLIEEENQHINLKFKESEQNFKLSMEDINEIFENKNKTKYSNQVTLTDNLLNSAISCHTATTEFLRLYWTSNLSNNKNYELSNRMYDYLLKTSERVDGVCQLATNDDEFLVLYQALEPILKGVNRVIEFERSK